MVKMLPSSSQPVKDEDSNQVVNNDLFKTAAQHGLVGLENIFELIKTVLWTGQVGGERPASCIIIAPIGSGKTSVMEKLQTEAAKFQSDFTSQTARSLIRDSRITHVMIGDFLSVLGHKGGTVDHSLNLLAKMTGEEVRNDPWNGEEINPPRKLGVVTAVPPFGLTDKKMKRKIWDSGFASRFIMARYEYTEKTIRRIHDFIASDQYTQTRPVQVIIPRGEVNVTIPADIAEKINLLARSVANDPIGARAHHHLRALVKARARMRKSETANELDFEIVFHMSDFFTKGGKRL